MSLGGYVNLDWDFWDAFTLSGGMRFNWEKREVDDYLLLTGPSERPLADPPGTDAQIVDHEPTGFVRLTYRPTEESSFYVKYTHGYKSGTFNAAGSIRNDGIEAAQPEKIDAFEVGVNGSYFDNRVNIRAAAFHYAYENYQLFTSRSIFRGPPQFVIVNASDVELYGTEFEATILPWKGGLFDVKFSWLEGEFLNYVRTELKPRVVGIVLIALRTEVDQSGHRLLNAPQFTFTMAAQQAFPIGRFGTIVARWDGSWKAKTYFDSTEGRGLPNADDVLVLPRNTIGQPAYWIHNVRLSYLTPDESIEVAAWVRNVEDKTYKTFSADLTTFQKTTLHFVGDPRTFGVTTSIRF
jgi:iron complex outermembrane receptor protein